MRDADVEPCHAAAILPEKFGAGPAQRGERLVDGSNEVLSIAVASFGFQPAAGGVINLRSSDMAMSAASKGSAA